MDATERKRFLQDQGILPNDDDGLMNPYAGEQESPAQDPAQTAPDPGANKPVDWGQTVADATRSYAKAYGVDAPNMQANPNDPREQLKKLVTPELINRLRERAGGVGSGR